MKSIKKYLFIMAALAAVFGFVACSDEDDDPSTVATYEATDEAMTLTFLDDNTWSVIGKVLGTEMTMAEGTYAGDPSKNGEILITTTKLMYANGGQLVDVSDKSPKEVFISSGKIEFMDYVFTRQ